MTDPAPSFTDAMRNFSDSLSDSLIKAGNKLSAQSAMGSMYEGDSARARGTLDRLPVEVLQWMSVCASALASIADEVAARKASPGPSSQP